MRTEYKSLEEVFNDHKEAKESWEKMGWLANVNKTLSEKMYAKEVHFIFELMQNAEDAKASEVWFQLEKDYIKFVHNGTKLFDLKDVHSITGYSSTKEADSNTIGKFGLGFKSVYCYTDFPQVYSGKLNFRIEDRLLPVKIAPLKEMREGDTCFILPFKGDEKEKQIAYEKIKKGLDNLGLEVLLFLKNIKKLNCVIERKTRSLVRKDKVLKENVAVISLEQDDEKPTQYLRFEKTGISLETNKGTVDNLTVSLAYKLNEKNEIVAVDDKKHKVYVYFPAEKEECFLPFLINAPFITPASRETLSDKTEEGTDNSLLIDELVNLQIESVPFLRDNGYLTTKSLEVFASSGDVKGTKYEPFNTELVALFRTEDFVPTMSGEFRAGIQLRRGEWLYTMGRNNVHIRDFLSDDDLAEYLSVSMGGDFKSPVWVKNASPNSEDRGSYDFMKDLDIKPFGKEQLLFIMSRETYRQYWQNLVQEKSADELVHLYRMIAENYVHRKDWHNAPIFRCQDGKTRSFDDGIYYDRTGKIDGQKYPLVDVADQENVYDVLEKIGVKAFSEESVCLEILRKYEQVQLTTQDISEEAHLQDMQVLLQGSVSYPSVRAAIVKHNLVLTAERRYVSCDRVFLDRRYGNSHDLMALVADVLNLHKISSLYEDKWGADKPEILEIFCQLLRDKGARAFLRYSKSFCSQNRRYATVLKTSYTKRCDTGIDEDYDIEGLKTILEGDRKKVSKLIWMSILQNGQNSMEAKVKARYKANQQDCVHTCEARFVQRLSDCAWILDKDGVLQYPEDMTFDDLPEDWEKPLFGVHHPVLKAIRFGFNSQEQQKEQEEKEKIAGHLGFRSAQDAQEALDLLNELKANGVSLDDVRKKCIRYTPTSSSSGASGDDGFGGRAEEEPQEIEFPSNKPKNEERLIDKVKEQYEEAKEREFVIRMRTVRDSRTNSEVKEYLENQYKRDEVMFCQLCQKPMPFKKPDGDYYFDAFPILEDMKKESEKLYLALCPNCSAEYRTWGYTIKENNKSFVEGIQEKTYGADDRNVVINLDFLEDKKKTMKFTKAHFLAVQTILNEESKKVETAQNEVAEVEASNTQTSEVTVPKSYELELVPCRGPLRKGEEVYCVLNQRWGKIKGAKGGQVIVDFGNEVKGVLLSTLKRVQ